MPRFLYVVARDRLDLYERLAAEFARDPGIAVILDRRGERRQGERRQGAGRDTPGPRRGGERRRRQDLQLELRTAGCFMVETE
jgi:hypothetical protein